MYNSLTAVGYIFERFAVVVQCLLLWYNVVAISTIRCIHCVLYTLRLHIGNRKSKISYKYGTVLTVYSVQYKVYSKRCFVCNGYSVVYSRAP